MSNLTKKWIWKMNWCKERRFPPASEMFWNMAEKAYNEKNNNL